MTKLKVHSGSKNRFKKTGKSLKHKRSGKRHILTKRTTKNKRHLRGTVFISKDNRKKVAKMLKRST